MENAVGDRSLKKLHHRRLNLIDSYISSYLYILNSAELTDLVRQANELAHVLGNI